MREIFQQAAYILRNKSSKRGNNGKPFEVFDDESGAADFQRRLSETPTKTPSRRESLRINSTSKLLLPWKRPVSDTQSECGTLDRRIGRRDLSRAARDSRQKNNALELRERPQTVCKPERHSLETSGWRPHPGNQGLSVLSSSLNGEAEMSSALANCTLPRAPRSRNLTCRKFSEQGIMAAGSLCPTDPVLSSRDVSICSVQRETGQDLQLHRHYMNWKCERYFQTSVPSEREVTEQMNLQNEMNDCRSVISDGSEHDSIRSDSTLVEAVVGQPTAEFQSEKQGGMFSTPLHQRPAHYTSKYPSSNKDAAREHYRPKPDLITTAERGLGRVTKLSDQFQNSSSPKISTHPSSKHLVGSSYRQGNNHSHSANKRTVSCQGRSGYGLNASFISLDNFPTLGQQNRLNGYNETDLRVSNKKVSEQHFDDDIEGQYPSNFDNDSDQTTGPLAYELEDIDEALYKENDMMRGPHKFDNKLNNDKRHQVRTPILKQITTSPCRPSWLSASKGGTSLYKLDRTPTGQWSSMGTLSYPSPSLTLSNSADIRVRASESLCNEKLSTDRQSGDSGFVDELPEYDSSPSFVFGHASSRESLNQENWAQSDPNLLRSSSSRAPMYGYEPTENIYSNIHSSSHDLFSKNMTSYERHSVLETGSNLSSVNASVSKTNKFNLNSLSSDYRISGEDPACRSSRDFSCESLNQFSSSSYEDVYRTCQSPSSNSRESILSCHESKASTLNRHADSLSKNGIQSLIILNNSRSDQLKQNKPHSGNFQNSIPLQKAIKQEHLRTKFEPLSSRLTDDTARRDSLKSIQRQAVIQYYQRCLGSGGRGSESPRFSSLPTTELQHDTPAVLSPAPDKDCNISEVDFSSEAIRAGNTTSARQTPVKTGDFRKELLCEEEFVSNADRSEISTTTRSPSTNTFPLKQGLPKECNMLLQTSASTEICNRSAHHSSPLESNMQNHTQVTEVISDDGVDQYTSVQALSVRLACPRAPLTMVTPDSHDNVSRSASSPTTLSTSSPVSAVHSGSDSSPKEAGTITESTPSSCPSAVYSTTTECASDAAMTEAQSAVTLPRHKRPFLRTISENALLSGLRRRPSARTVTPSISSSNSFTATSIKSANRKVFGRRPTFLRAPSHRDAAPSPSSETPRDLPQPAASGDEGHNMDWPAAANQLRPGTASDDSASTPVSCNSSLQRISSLARKLHWRQHSGPSDDPCRSLPRGLWRHCPDQSRGQEVPSGSSSCQKLERTDTGGRDEPCVNRLNQKDNSSYHRDSCVIRSADWRSVPEGKYKRTGSPTLVKLSPKTTANESPSTVSKSVSTNALNKANLTVTEATGGVIYNRGSSKSILQRTAPCLSRVLMSRSETNMADPAKFSACDTDSAAYPPDNDLRSGRLTKDDSSARSESQNIASSERRSYCCSNDLTELSFNQRNSADTPAALSLSQRLGRSASTSLSTTSSSSSHADDIHVDETRTEVKGGRLNSYRSCDQLLLEMPTSDFSESTNVSPDHTPSPKSSGSVSSLSPTPLFSSRSTTSVSSSTSTGSSTSDNSSTPQPSTVENVEAPATGPELASGLRRARVDVEDQFARYCTELMNDDGAVPAQLHALLVTIPQLAKTHCETVCRLVDSEFFTDISQKPESSVRNLVNKDIINSLPAKLRTSLIKFRQRIGDENCPNEDTIGQCAGKSSIDRPSSRQIELVSRISSKLSVLKEERQAVAGELEANTALGTTIRQRLQQHTPSHHLLQRYDTHVQQVSTVTALLLGLSARLARAQSAIDVVPDDSSDRAALLGKRQSLLTQLHEAEQLQANIERRGEQLCEALRELLSECQLDEYRRFISTKAKLVMQSRELDDKLRLGEEQLCAAVADWN